MLSGAAGPYMGESLKKYMDEVLKYVGEAQRIYN